MKMMLINKKKKDINIELKSYKKIEELEREGKFDVDAEEDPATIVLTPENIDYLRKKKCQVN